MMLRVMAYLLIIALSYFLTYKFSIDYTFSDYKEYSTILISVSSMIFTIMGIWIAFLYPNALNRLMNPKVETVDFSEAMQETKRLEALVGSVLKSAVVTLCILLIFLAKVIFFKTVTYQNHIILIKEIALSFTVFLTVVQIEAVAYVVYSNIMFLNDLHNKREDRQADQDV